MNNYLQIATLAGGCFWCIEAVFDELNGVVSVESGYSGGKIPNPNYQIVCTGMTGHAEAVQINFDPNIISYADLLRVFFTVHDPTTPNRQGADTGTQYRSAIFYHDDAQKEIAAQIIREITESKVWKDPIVTDVSPFDKFYIAEDYHQEYYVNNSNQPYCRAVIEPKVSKFRKHFLERLKRPQHA
jgi:peptide-methionine (S)-S-oxide reductase